MSSEIQFCADCSNLLYPKEDREHKQLIFLCRSCDHLQYADPYSATQNCVDRLNYNFRSKEDVNSYIAQGLGHDPTLPRAPDWKCPKCPHMGAVYFQLPERVADDAMTLVFVCTHCTFYQVKGKESQEEDTVEGQVMPAEPLIDDDQGELFPELSGTQRANKPNQIILNPKNDTHLETNDDNLFADDNDSYFIDSKLDEVDEFEELGLGASDDEDPCEGIDPE